MVAAAMALILATASPSRGLPDSSDPLVAVIGRARTALGPGLTSVRSTYVAGTVEFGGLKGTYEAWNDRSTGRYAMLTNLGPLSGGEGYDGTSAWWRDSKGIVLPQTGPATEHRTATSVFSLTDALYKPNYGGAKVSYLGMRDDSGRSYAAIKVQVPSRTPIKHWYELEDWFDATTGLPAREIKNIDGQTTITNFSGYQNVDGLMMAHEVQAIQDSGTAEVIKLTQARADVPDLENHLRRPASSANDFSLPGGQTSIPFALVDHHVVVDVYINGKGPFHFLFDSGASNLMDPTIAWNVGAHSIATLPQRAIGQRTMVAQFAKVDQLSIGGATLRDQYFAVAQIERPFSTLMQGMTFHSRGQGLIGREVLARFVTTIDYAAGKIVLQTPVGAAKRVNETAVPLLFDFGNAEFACRINGIDATCLIDTGSWWSVTVTSRFAHDNPEIAPKSFGVSGYTGSGLSGISRGIQGPLGSFQIGPITLTNLDAQFSTDTKGGLAARAVAAIVGNQVWDRYRLTFDYPNALMFLAPNSGLDG
jgi:predicted aspartyl protease